MADQATQGAGDSGSVWDDLANSYSGMRDLTRQSYAPDANQPFPSHSEPVPEGYVPPNLRDQANRQIPKMDTVAGAVGGAAGTLVGDIQGMWDYVTG
jgi:hypothetical protein